MKNKTINVTFSSHEYPIIIGENLLNNLTIFEQYIKGRQVLLVTNETIEKLLLNKFSPLAKQYEYQHVILPDGEQYKTLQSFEKILDVLAEHHHHRDTTLIALGGGVIGDITGFAAACYQRGVNFIQVPTTLLAQVDASIGGKTAIDHKMGKNLIGAFHQPQAVIIDIETLDTLPDREFRAGLAEIIKAAIIQDADFFDWLEQKMGAILQREKDVLITAIEKACIIKRNVVVQDEKEMGLRAILNFGHTFGHAIEQNLQYENWLHGEAVALGMLMAADLSVEIGWLNSAECARIHKLIHRAISVQQLPTQVKCATLLRAMHSDKKIQDNQLKLILLKGLGKPVITSDIPSKKIEGVIMHYTEEK